MPKPNSKALSSIFASAVKKASNKNSKSTSSSSSSSSSSKLATLKKLTSLTTTENPSKEPPSKKPGLKNAAPSGDPPIQYLKDMSSLIFSSSALKSHNSSSQIPIERKSSDNVLNIPWGSDKSITCSSPLRKELSRERKGRWIYKNTQMHRFDQLVRMSAQKLGTEATLDVFGKLGRETGVKEYNALINLCIEKAREGNDEDISLDHIHKAFQLFSSMREQGFPLEEETYGPFLVYLIDMGMIQEFHFFSKFVKDENPSSFSRLAYYEMLLWIAVKDEEKVQELCNSVGLDSSSHSLALAENYLLALCKHDMQKEILQLLELVDVTKISSMKFLTDIFKSLGRLALESYVEKFILAFRLAETQEEEISSLIYNYAISIPNLEVEEVVSKFKSLHKKLQVRPSYASYDNLITYCCDLLKVHAALDIVDLMRQSGLAVSIKTLQPILHASERSFDFDLVRPMYSLMHQLDLKPEGETFKSMISLSVKMKDYEGAYNMLKDMEEMNMTPTANMYNAIMAGYFREYYEELQRDGVQVTKHVYMALINAYAKFGQFEKAKQVLVDGGIPVKNINEIKSALVSALASNGQILDALNIYEEVKEAGCHLEPKAIISLIEYIQSEGELNKLLELLGELNVLGSWFDGCSRVVLYCVRYKHLSSAVDLLKKLKEKDEAVTYLVFDQIFSQISDTEPTDLESGMYLLQAIKEELRLCPSRTSLDFLLSTCASARDPHHAQLIWEEYQKANLCFNVMTYLRMYQVLLASGMRDSAQKLLKKIPEDDPHVRQIIKACKKTYSGMQPVCENLPKGSSFLSI
ncbi:hypothetical protein AAC387_Pa10g0838 [Persea americana]